MTSDGLNCEWLSPYKRKVTGSKPVTGNPVHIEFIALYGQNLSLGTTRTDHLAIEIETRAEAQVSTRFIVL